MNIIDVILWVSVFLHFVGSILMDVRNNSSNFFELLLVVIPGWTIVYSLIHFKLNPPLAIFNLATGFIAVVCLFSYS